MKGGRHAKLWAECGKFHNNSGVEALLRPWGVCDSQQLTAGASGGEGPIARPSRD